MPINVMLIKSISFTLLQSNISLIPNFDSFVDLPTCHLLVQIRGSGVYIGKFEQISLN